MEGVATTGTAILCRRSGRVGSLAILVPSAAPQAITMLQSVERSCWVLSPWF